MFENSKIFSMSFKTQTRISITLFQKIKIITLIIVTDLLIKVRPTT